MARNQSLKKLEKVALEKIAELHFAPDEELSPFMPDHLRECAIVADRIEEGGYGTCVDCEQNIPLARLRAKPEAVRCVKCQSQHERLRSAAPALRINPHMRSAS